VRHVGAAVEIDAPVSVVWDVLTDLNRWPAWGPSIRRVASAADRADAGVTGRVQTVVGIWLPFEITWFEPGRAWFWNVAGIPATRHYVSAIEEDRCRVQFTVAWVVAPYLLVLRVALGRLRRMAE
jgi:uncharacterized protein YndB with AHSA1/START domain